MSYGMPYAGACFLATAGQMTISPLFPAPGVLVS